MAARIAFLFFGGPHQVLHTAPVAAELAGRPDLEIVALTDTPQTARAVEALTARLGATVRTQVIGLPRWTRWLGRLAPKWSDLKLLRLLALWRRAQDHDVLVTAERTSTVLKRLPGLWPVMAHIPHGAGDRAKGFEPRIKLFDHVLTAGEKDRRRLIEAGLATEATCTATGYVKMGAVQRLGRTDPPRFKRDRPIVLYNPHFDPRLGSWEALGRQVIAAFAAQDRYNLIVAPHVRLFACASEAQRAAIQDLATDTVFIDLGSPASNDMTYTQAASIYLGDVSSQVYEFIATPRPCLFLNSHQADWAHSPDYACWNFGEVLNTTDDVIGAVDRAVIGHPARRVTQALAAADALGDPSMGATRAAAAIVDIAKTALRRQRAKVIRMAAASPVSATSSPSKPALP